MVEEHQAFQSELRGFHSQLQQAVRYHVQGLWNMCNLAILTTCLVSWVGEQTAGLGFAQAKAAKSKAVAVEQSVALEVQDMRSCCG
eukprot:3761950-Amphidinium_carterae.1